MASATLRQSPRDGRTGVKMPCSLGKTAIIYHDEVQDLPLRECEPKCTADSAISAQTTCQTPTLSNRRLYALPQRVDPYVDEGQIQTGKCVTANEGANTLPPQQRHHECAICVSLDFLRFATVYGPKVGHFEYYIRMAYGGGLPFGPLFNVYPDQSPPMLSRGRINRFLVFPGGFNPPHRGHLDLLHAAMFDSGSQWNFIGAIVHLRDDNFLARKNGFGMQLSQKQRLELWNAQASDYFWVCDRDISCGAFVDTMKKLMMKDGFQVEWACLVGPDYVSSRRELKYKPCGLDFVVSSDGFRKADFIEWDGDTPSLESVRSYGRWEKSPLKSRNNTRTYNGKMASRASDYNPGAQDGIPNSNNPSSYNYVCRHLLEPERKILFIPRKDRPYEVSATMIRDLFIRYAHDTPALVAGLAPLVPNAIKLLEVAYPHALVCSGESCDLNRWERVLGFR